MFVFEKILSSCSEGVVGAIATYTEKGKPTYNQPSALYQATASLTPSASFHLGS